VSLRDKLKALEELQKIDLEILELRVQSGSLPKRQREIEASLSQVRAGYDAEKARLESNEREKRQSESLLAMEREKVKKWESRLGEIKTPREYAALSREIDIAKKSNEAQTEQAKLLSAQGNEIRSALQAKEDEMHTREEAAQSELNDIKAKLSEQQKQVQALEGRRAEQAKLVDAGLLGKYEAIKRRRAGIAVVAVIGTTCKGCNMNIPPQLSNILRRADTIEVCPNCQRIIYSADAVNPPAPSPA
jgi:predicted  nucleic acid-binding Zn-ribbon protein